jgi:DNA-binding CsgD family transcriptional regulator
MQRDREYHGLSRRQYECLLLYARHGTIELAARNLGLRESTVKNYLHDAYGRLGVSSAINAIRALGWLNLPE